MFFWVFGTVLTWFSETGGTRGFYSKEQLAFPGLRRSSSAFLLLLVNQDPPLNCDTPKIFFFSRGAVLFSATLHEEMMEPRSLRKETAHRFRFSHCFLNGVVSRRQNRGPGREPDVEPRSRPPASPLVHDSSQLSRKKQSAGQGFLAAHMSGGSLKTDSSSGSSIMDASSSSRP